MAVKHNFCEVDTWTVSDLVDASKQEPEGKRRITIPQFQRRLVWTKEKQEKLIASLKAGFPVGSWLLFEDISYSDGSDKSKRNYKLIDGLQRTQALRSYVNEPTKFFSRDDISEQFIDVVKNALSSYSVNDEFIVTIIVNWVRGLRGFSETDGWGVDGLSRAFVDNLVSDANSDSYRSTFFDVSQNGTLRRELAQFLKDVREASDISKARLPIITYNGPASELPLVFELLNSQGTALSRYEIYAAQWMDHRRSIANQSIIDSIWSKYDEMIDAGYLLDVTEDAPDDRTKKTKEYTLFEYLFGLGQYLSNRYPRLFKRVTVDQPSSAGFNLVAACLSLNVKDMVKLPDRLQNIDLNKLEETIIESVNFVLGVFEPILSVKQKNGSISVYHSEYQILSMIGVAFSVRYDYRNNFSENDGWRKHRSTLERHLPMYYLYDILRDYWRGTGDVKLYDATIRLRYLGTPPSKSSWGQVLDNWFLDNQMVMQHNRRLVRDVSQEILFLKYIYAHKLTVAENAKTYHVEHIIPVDQLISIMSKDDRLPINVVSNLALLRALPNVKKGNKTFKEYLDAMLDSEVLTEDDYQQELNEMADQLICAVERLPDPLTKESFETFLYNRFNDLKDEFFRLWNESIQD